MCLRRATNMTWCTGSVKRSDPQVAVSIHSLSYVYHFDWNLHGNNMPCSTPVHWWCVSFIISLHFVFHALNMPTNTMYSLSHKPNSSGCLSALPMPVPEQKAWLKNSSGISNVLQSPPCKRGPFMARDGWFREDCFFVLDYWSEGCSTIIALSARTLFHAALHSVFGFLTRIGLCCSTKEVFFLLPLSCFSFKFPLDTEQIACFIVLYAMLDEHMFYYSSQKVIYTDDLRWH